MTTSNRTMTEATSPTHPAEAAQEVSLPCVSARRQLQHADCTYGLKADLCQVQVSLTCAILSLVPLLLHSAVVCELCSVDPDQPA